VPINVLLSSLTKQFFRENIPIGVANSRKPPRYWEQEGGNLSGHLLSSSQEV